MWMKGMQLDLGKRSQSKKKKKKKKENHLPLTGCLFPAILVSLVKRVLRLLTFISIVCGHFATKDPSSQSYGFSSSHA